MSKHKLEPVYVYPDDEVYNHPPEWKSDDYQVRLAGQCLTCEEQITPHYGEPFASCECGTAEWYL